MRPGLAVAAGAGLVAAVVVGWLRRRYVSVTVVGDSMSPTLHPGDRVLVRRVPLHLVRHGDVVVVAPPPDLEAPADDPPWLVKRAVALPGDPVPAEVTHLDPPSGGRVPPGALVILGDNRARSYDSRRAGFFPADRLLGVVVRPPLPAAPPSRAPGASTTASPVSGSTVSEALIHGCRARRLG